VAERVVEAAVAARPVAGEERSGDLAVIELLADGALVAAVDALGHGPEAAAAADVAGAVLREFAAAPPRALVERCHEALRRTRGAVMSVAVFDARDASMTWVGVGNVEAVLLRRRAPAGAPPREVLTARGGVVGYTLPPLHASALPVARGDTLVLASDGIRSGFAVDLEPHGTPQEMADAILAQHARGSDDALVLVVRYIGEQVGEAP
jgi:hypothetical protein